MQVEKSYEENILVGPYESVKIGLIVKSDKEIHSQEELEQHCEKLLQLIQNIVRKELIKIKEERLKEKEETNAS